MRVRTRRRLEGPCGHALELRWAFEAEDQLDWRATVAAWFLHCPGQSPAWDCYALSVIHLRPIEGVRPATIREPGATHEVLMVAYDPAYHPNATDPDSWAFLTPANVTEQVVLPGDEAAEELGRMAAHAVVEGWLPAEPMLSGAREPWRTSLRKTAAHLRGEEH